MLSREGAVPRGVAVCPECCASLSFAVETVDEMGDGARATSVLLACPEPRRVCDGGDDAKWEPCHDAVIRWINGALPNEPIRHAASDPKKL